MAPQFRVFVEGRAGAFTMQCAGELDIATINRARQAFERCIALLPLELHVDWRGLTFMGVEGARLLFEGEEWCRSLGIQFRATLSPAAARVDRLVRAALEGRAALRGDSPADGLASPTPIGVFPASGG
jgi:anti-anti-sigma regulatory factor